jgi:uncharacterized membrane protein HdeD (DUF308 family)
LIHTLIKNWWLLAVGGVLDAIISVIYFNHAGHGFVLKGTIVFLGKLTLAAGACTIAAGIWRSRNGKCWLLALNGLALGVLGLIFNGIFGFRISFLTVALLLVVTAMSIGVFELVIARTLQRLRHVADEWFLGFAGAASVGFALAFFALGFRLIKIESRSHSDLLWLGSYFGFSAICMLWLALRLHILGLSQSSQWEALSTLGNPKHAH